MIVSRLFFFYFFLPFELQLLTVLYGNIYSTVGGKGLVVGTVEISQLNYTILYIFSNPLSSAIKIADHLLINNKFIKIIAASYSSIKRQVSLSIIELTSRYRIQRWKWVSGSWVTALDPLTHDHKISAQYLAFFVLS